MKHHKKKGEIKRPRPSLKLLLRNYFLSSWWIANLGVDPCWRFFALRRAPMFLWRRARLFSVTLVLETISQLRQLQRFTLKFRSHFLPLAQRPVKRFMLLAAISALNMANAESLFMAIGEHSELKVPDLKEFSVSNSDTLSHKYRPGQKSLLLRGKRQGHAEVVVWNKSGPKQTWNVYVLSKAKHLKWMESMKALEDLGITTQAQGKLVRISGELESRSDWEAFRELSHELEAQKELSFINLAQPCTKLKHQLLAEIYQQFLLQHADTIDCSWSKQGPWIKCLVPNGVMQREEIKSLLPEITKKHFVKIESVLESAKLTNYKLTFHLYKLEKREQLETDLTVERAAGSLADLSRKRLIELARSDDFVLGEGRYKLSTVATPEIIIRHDKEFNLQMGSDLPYQATQGNESVTTSFRFAGLKITGILSSSALGNILDYEVELSAPVTEGVISGNKKSSSILLREASEITAFSLNYKNSGIEKRSLPGLSRIPVLGVLFSDTIDMQEEKVIIGNITVERL